MKTNHQRGFVAENDEDRMDDPVGGGVFKYRQSRKRNQRWSKRSKFADKDIHAYPWAQSGKRLQRGKHGAKHFLRSRFRFHEKMQLKKELLYEDDMNDKTYNFFWSGPYSQWDPSPFTLGGIKFSCAEQSMMFFKAIFVEDADMAKAIMATEDPQEQKAFGRRVKNFNAAKWDRVAYSLVYMANISKFMENQEHLRYIITDAADMIVEASPEDTIWGIGMGQGDPDIMDESKWKGQNLLGKVCMEVRDYLRNPGSNMETYNKHNQIMTSILVDKTTNGFLETI
jgi:ribA/ribD-fused uncharacterized protein